MQGGIYIILNISTYNFYIGSTCDFNKRKLDHFSGLRRNDHGNDRLQKAYNKYGNENFRFLEVEYCKESDLESREQYYLDTLLFAQEYIRGEDKRFKKYGYNLNPLAYRGGTYGKVVYQYTMDGEYVRAWPNVTQAARAVKPNNYQTALAVISKVCRGKVPYAYDYFWSYAEITEPFKIIKAKRMLSQEHLAKMIVGRKGKVLHTPKPIIQLDLLGKFIKKWDSVKDAAKVLNPDNLRSVITGISYAINNPTKNSYDSKWCWESIYQHHPL
jgi:group I intron endonuclease